MKYRGSSRECKVIDSNSSNAAASGSASLDGTHLTDLFRRRPPVSWATIAISAALLGMAVWYSIFLLTRPDKISIRHLQEVAVGARVNIQGVVTYADSAGKRFWIQDDTGAVAVDEDPRKYGLGAGQSLVLEGTKSQPYNSAIGPRSVALSDIKVRKSQRGGQIPPPPTASLRALPINDKAGIRVRVSGIVRDITTDELGRTELAIGEWGREVLVTVADTEANGAKWIDAKVEVVGVGETSFPDNYGTPAARHIWVQSSTDIQLRENAPAQSPLFSVRGLYRDPDSKNGHKIRVRGRVAAQPTPTSLLLEDRWGTLDCRLRQAQTFAVGAPVEVAGYPGADVLRVDLLHSVVASISESQLAETEKQDDDLRDLTTVASLRRLTPNEAADAPPVQVTGVITYNDPDWRALFLQDSTGGIYVKYAGARIPLMHGQKVTVRGLANPGDYAPVIIAPKFQILGKGHLPAPIPVTARSTASETVHGARVEIEGVIRPIDLSQANHVNFDLYTSFGRVRVNAGPEFTGVQRLQDLVDATVRIRGVFGAVFNSRRQQVGYQLWVPSADDIRVLDPPVRALFEKPAIPVADLLRFVPHVDFNHRVKVQGSVTMIGKTFLYVQDESGGLEVRSDPKSLRVGDMVEAVGYASAEGRYSPVLTDAMVRLVRHHAPVIPKPMKAESGEEGQYDSQLVTVDGRVLGVVDTLSGRTLVLQSGARTFNAQLDTTDSEQLMPDLQEGAFVQLAGVCSVQVDPNKLYLMLTYEPLGFRILLRSAQDVTVLKPASWWTVRRTLYVVGILLAGILATLGQVTMLRRRVRRQNDELRQADAKARAISDLVGTMQTVTGGQDFAARVKVGGNDEIAMLGVEFNKMLSELQKRDVAKKEAETKLQHQALTDELTGLPNRRLLSDRLNQTLALAKRESHLVALLYIDLDGFKLVNDSLGHTVGDLLLGHVANRLRSRIRESDTLARLGGDEFTVVLTTLRARGDAELVGHSLLEVLSKPFVIDNHEITISASIGISFFPETSTDAMQLLQQADSAMYAAKRDGKNRTACFTPQLGSLVRERVSLEVQLRSAIAHGEIKVHYQPEFDVSTQRLIRFEALARWNHATLGNIPPAKFIPIAEESGLIIPLGAYIMERACADAVKWQSLSPHPVQIAVNVSSLQFARDTFVDEVSEILRHTGLPPELLQIELTESIMLSGTMSAGETMRRLRALGISLAIDDFGTGYSCLSYLPKLAFDALKIDRSFVSELEYRPETKAMVHSLVTLAHNLNMRVIVEGVETPQQLELIQKFGGNEVQGFLLGRPTGDPESQLRAALDQKVMITPDALKAFERATESDSATTVE